MSTLNIQSENSIKIVDDELVNYIKFIKQSPNPEVYLNTFQVLVRMLVENHGIDMQDHNGFTPLMHLCLHLDNVSFYENILSFHPNLDLKNNEGRTALMLACDYKRYDVIKFLLDSGADINVLYHTDPDQYGHRIRFLTGIDSDHYKILYYDGSCVPSIFMKHMYENDMDLKIAKLLLTYDITTENLNKTLIALSSNSNGDFDDLITLVIEKCADINFQDSHGGTALMEACFNGDLRLVKRLLSHYANISHSVINIKDNDGATALLHACGYRNGCDEHMDDIDEIIPLLLNLSPDFDVQDSSEHKTPLLHYCSHSNYNIEILKVLCAKSNLNHKDKHGMTALMWYCAGNEIVDIEVLKMLLSPDVDINSQCDDGETALLFIKFTKENYDAIKFLLADHNANINLGTKDGNTALMIACKDNKVDLVHLFLEYGAQLHYGSKTAFDLTTDPYMKNLIKRYLPQNSYKSCDLKQCFICSDVDNMRYVQLHCNHVFHYNCIDRWLFDQRTCPECRAIIY
jgi:ankyrin repeat protein